MILVLKYGFFFTEWYLRGKKVAKMAFSNEFIVWTE